jgi:hypothetical protein
MHAGDKRLSVDSLVFLKKKELLLMLHDEEGRGRGLKYGNNPFEVVMIATLLIASCFPGSMAGNFYQITEGYNSHFDSHLMAFKNNTPAGNALHLRPEEMQPVGQVRKIICKDNDLLNIVNGMFDRVETDGVVANAFIDLRSGLGSQQLTNYIQFYRINE